MTYLLHLGLALAAQVIWESTSFAATPRPWLLLLLACVPAVLGASTRRLYLRGRFRAADHLFFATTSSPVVLHAIAVLGAGWNESVADWTGAPPELMSWPEPAALLALLPFAVYSLLAIDARARLGGGARAQGTRRSHARMFAATVLPLVVYVLISAAVGASARLRLEIETVALWNALYGALLLLLFAASVPWLFSRTWDMRPLPAGAERDLLDAVSRRAGFDGRRLYLWNTGNSAANAAIIGLFPAHRIVVFSDLLLARLDLRQLASVYAHEIGHAKRNHVLIFAAWALVALLGADLVAARVAPHDPAWTAAILLAAMAAWALAFGWMSRRFELEADVYSVRLIGEAAPLVQALEEVSGPHSRRRTSWRHFSTERRIEFLEAAQREPALATRLERRLRLAARLGFAAVAVVLALHAASLVADWPRDRVIVDLRRGDYASAARRVERSALEDESLGRLVRRAAALPTGAAGDPAELERRARAALAARDLAAAGDWLELGALRGDLGMALALAVVGELEASAEPGRAGPPESLLAALPEDWRRAFEALLPPGAR